MNVDFRAHPYASIALALLIVGVACTALLVGLVPPEEHRRLFWFPDTAGAALHAEWREVPYRVERTEQIELYIDELILGPIALGAVPIVSRETSLNTIVLTETGTLYLDFDRSILFGLDEAFGNPDSRIELVKRNIKHNFRHVEAIVVTIEGQLPNEPRFTAVGR